MADETLALDGLGKRQRRLADNLLGDCERLRLQLFAPSVEVKSHVVSDGPAGSHVEIVELHRSEPTFAGKRLIVAAIAEAVGKIQVLAGETHVAAAEVEDWSAPVVGLATVRDTPKRKAGNARPRARADGKPSVAEAVDAVAATRGRRRAGG